MTESEVIEELKHSIVSYEAQNKNNITCDLTREILNMAINALEKQIPKKPSIINKIGFMQKKCASCGSEYLPFDGKYCPECGQRLE